MEIINIESIPECDICREFDRKRKAYVDGKTVHGPWANMCELCFMVHGMGIGTQYLEEETYNEVKNQLYYGV